MGKDKYENEDLIKYAWPDRDIWFHVAELSSAHVYIRVPEGFTDIKSITPELVQECAQLTKANSIEGCKKDHVGINYTWARNLKKTAGMDTGAVSFHKPSEVMFIKIETDKQLVKTISKTKDERYPDLKKELEEHVASIVEEEREKNRALIAEQKEIKQQALAAQNEKKDFFNQQKKTMIQMQKQPEKFAIPESKKKKVEIVNNDFGYGDEEMPDGGAPKEETKDDDFW